MLVTLPQFSATYKITDSVFDIREKIYKRSERQSTRDKATTKAQDIYQRYLDVAESTQEKLDVLPEAIHIEVYTIDDAYPRDVFEVSLVDDNGNKKRLIRRMRCVRTPEQFWKLMLAQAEKTYKQMTEGKLAFPDKIHYWLKSL